jgi:hypothetical protein
MKMTNKEAIELNFWLNQNEALHFDSEKHPTIKLPNELLYCIKKNRRLLKPTIDERDELEKDIISLFDEQTPKESKDYDSKLRVFLDEEQKEGTTFSKFMEEECSVQLHKIDLDMDTVHLPSGNADFLEKYLINNLTK